VFGELAFFSGLGRTATVRALKASELAVIRGRALFDLCARHPGLNRALESVYHERLLRKAGEDTRDNPLIDLKKDTILTFSFSRGQEISFDCEADITIIKHGVVEVCYDDRGLQDKRFLRPGFVARSFKAGPRLHDVEIHPFPHDLLGIPPHEN
jgi:hypothetical protein